MTNRKCCDGLTVRSLVGVILWTSSVFSAEPVIRTHPAMRPLPKPVNRPMPKTEGRSYFVDPNRGNDSADGSEKAPWKSIGRAVQFRDEGPLRPGDTIYLRSGTYYENVMLPTSGEETQPITLRSYPGELAIIDGGLKEFYETPETAWKPFENGAKDEYVSTKTYPQFAARPIITAFPPNGWEPFYGKENERPLVLGHFADSMVPLHGYRTLTDLRDSSMLWDVGNKFEVEEGVYCGPGLWFNRETLRIHIRLAHTNLQGLGKRNYEAETDPRKVPLCISGPYGRDVLRINGVNHIVLQDLVLRGASGSAMINLYGSDHITLEGLTCYGGAPGLLANASSQVKILDTAFRGLAAPWSSRASMKYRGTPSYQLITLRNQPQNHDWEISHCEFTDDHDGIWLRYVKNLKFHHNYMDNFNDDGVEVGARTRDQELYIYQNLLSNCQLTFTLHEMERDESPPDVDPGSGVYITRNIIDLRGGNFKAPPKEPDPTGRFLNGNLTLCGDHGGPTWPNYIFYHNTVLRNEPAWRGYYGFGMGGRGLGKSERRVLNNIFVQIKGVPGLNIHTEGDIVLDGNLHWGILDGPNYEGDYFAKEGRTFAFRKKPFPENWIKHDVFQDPKFTLLTENPTDRFDVTLASNSPAVNAGVRVPDDWFDPLRHEDPGKPDLGAVPAKGKVWNVGVRGRLSVFGEATEAK